MFCIRRDHISHQPLLSWSPCSFRSVCLEPTASSPRKVLRFQMNGRLSGMFRSLVWGPFRFFAQVASTECSPPTAAPPPDLVSATSALLNELQKACEATESTASHLYLHTLVRFPPVMVFTATPSQWHAVSTIRQSTAVSCDHWGVISLLATNHEPQKRKKKQHWLMQPPSRSLHSGCFARIGEKYGQDSVLVSLLGLCKQES